MKLRTLPEGLSPSWWRRTPHTTWGKGSEFTSPDFLGWQVRKCSSNLSHIFRFQRASNSHRFLIGGGGSHPLSYLTNVKPRSGAGSPTSCCGICGGSRFSCHARGLETSTLTSFNGIIKDSAGSQRIQSTTPDLAWARRRFISSRVVWSLRAGRKFCTKRVAPGKKWARTRIFSSIVKS